MTGMVANGLQAFDHAPDVVGLSQHLHAFLFLPARRKENAFKLLLISGGGRK